jgi:hypothetical protein
MANKLKWIKVDIDGTGERWRLAVLRKTEFSDSEWYFPVEDFECLKCEMEDCDKIEVTEPETTINHYQKIEQAALAVCKTASATANDNRSSVNRKELNKLQDLLFNYEEVDDG